MLFINIPCFTKFQWLYRFRIFVYYKVYVKIPRINTTVTTHSPSELPKEGEMRKNNNDKTNTMISSEICTLLLSFYRTLQSVIYSSNKSRLSICRREKSIYDKMPRTKKKKKKELHHRTRLGRVGRKTFLRERWGLGAGADQFICGETSP